MALSQQSSAMRSSSSWRSLADGVRELLCCTRHLSDRSHPTGTVQRATWDDMSVTFRRHGRPNSGGASRFSAGCQTMRNPAITVAAVGVTSAMARRADDLSTDPAVVLIEEPAESFDAWLRELLVDPPVELDTTGAELVAQARVDET